MTELLSAVVMVHPLLLLRADGHRDLSPLQQPSRPVREAAKHYLSGARFTEAGSYDAALSPRGFEAAYGGCPGERFASPAELELTRKAGRASGGRRQTRRAAGNALTAAQTVEEDQERGRKRVELLKQRYASGCDQSATSPSARKRFAARCPNLPSAAPEPTRQSPDIGAPCLTIRAADGGWSANGGRHWFTFCSLVYVSARTALI